MFLQGESHRRLLWRHLQWTGKDFGLAIAQGKPTCLHNSSTFSVCLQGVYARVITSEVAFTKVGTRHPNDDDATAKALEVRDAYITVHTHIHNSTTLHT